MDLKPGKSIIKKNIIMKIKLSNKSKYCIFLFIFLISCSSYENEFKDSAIEQHKIRYELENIDFDEEKIIEYINLECELIEEGIEDHIADDLPIHYFIDFYYIIIRNSDNSPDDVEKYMYAIFNYCNFGEELRENWDSLEVREESYQKFNS